MKSIWDNLLVRFSVVSLVVLAEKVRAAVNKELLKPALETVTEPSENSYPGPRPASGTFYRR
jgi:hypothetical protein